MSILITSLEIAEKLQRKLMNHKTTYNVDVYFRGNTTKEPDITTLADDYKYYQTSKILFIEQSSGGNLFVMGDTIAYFNVVVAESLPDWLNQEDDEDALNLNWLLETASDEF